MSRGDSRIPIALSCAWLLGCCAGPHSIAAAQALFSGLDLPPNATTAQAVAINDNGLVLMWTGFEGGRSWLRTPDGTFIDPAPPPGLTGSFLRGINDLDYAVGSAGGMAAVRAPDGAWTFLMPGAMFDPDGWSGPEESAMRGFMLTLPHLPEPSLGGVILVGVLLLCRRRCRR